MCFQHTPAVINTLVLVPAGGETVRQSIKHLHNSARAVGDNAMSISLELLSCN